MRHLLPVGVFSHKPLDSFGFGDLEDVLLQAYAKARYSSPLPGFYDIANCFWDILEDLGLPTVYCSLSDLTMHKNEIPDEILESTLFYLGCEFVDSDGEHLNEAQNKLFNNWTTLRPVHYHEQDWRNHGRLYHLEQ